MNLSHYMLVNREIVECTLKEWAIWIENYDRTIAKDIIDDIMISTVFLGLDYNPQNYGLPILFETMIFGGPLNEEMDRYCTYDEAEEGHKKMVERVRQSIFLDQVLKIMKENDKDGSI